MQTINNIPFFVPHHANSILLLNFQMLQALRLADDSGLHRLWCIAAEEDPLRPLP